MRLFAAWIVCVASCSARAADPADPAFPFAMSLTAGTHPSGALLQWTMEPKAAVLRPGDTGEFVRPSPAARATAKGEQAVPPGVPLTEPVLGVSASDGEYRSEKTSGVAAVVPAFVKDGLLYGTSVSRRIFTSVDGETWTLHGSATSNQLILLRSGAILSIDNMGPRLRVFRSTDNAMTFHQSVWEADGAPFEWITPGAFAAPFSFHQSDSGVVVMAEYKLPEGARYLYRSGDDGASWKLVFDGAAGGLELTHYHAVSKHEGLNRWLAATGDGPSRQRYIISDDDALTWRDYFSQPGQIYSQPTFFLNYGHPTRFLFGSDLAYQVGWVDISDGPTARQKQSTHFNWDGRPAKNYSFYMWKHGGCYYATSTDASNTMRNPVISVSRDGATWSIYHRLENADSGVIAFAGYLAGRMHMVVGSAQGRRHLALSPAETTERDATFISNESTNLADVALANAETTDGWHATDPQYFSVSPEAHTGDSCLRYRRTDGNSAYLISRPVNALPGDVIQARLWVRGAGGSCLFRWSVNYGDAGESVLFGLSRQEWQEVVTRPLVVPANAQIVRLLILAGPNTDNDLEIEIDTISVEHVAASQWQPPAQSRSADRWTVTRPVGAAWTDVFTIRPRVIRDALPEYSSPLRVKSYRLVDGSGKTSAGLDVMYQPTGGVRVIYTDAGGRPRVQVLPADFFQRDAQLRFVVRQDWTGATIGVSDGRPLRTILVETPARLTDGELVIHVGADSAAKTLAATWLDNIFYDYAIEDDDLSEAVRPANLAERQAMTNLVIERRTGLGPFAPIATVPATESQFIDTDALLSEPVAYRVRASRGGTNASAGPVAVLNTGPGIDFNDDGAVDVRDHAALMRSFGRCVGSPMYLARCDLDADGCVTSADADRYFMLLSLGHP